MARLRQGEGAPRGWAALAGPLLPKGGVVMEQRNDAPSTAAVLGRLVVKLVAYWAIAFLGIGPFSD